MAASFVDTIVGQTMRLDLTKTLGGSKDLTGLCTDLFLIVIRMREAEDLGDPASLRKLIMYFIDLFEKNCKAINISDESILESKYAIVALLDETVLSNPGNCRDFWFTRPLQLDFFGDNIAGEEFYNKLQRLQLQTEKKKDVIEVYYLCLSLGYEGKYKIFNGEERIALIEDLGRKLRRTRIRASSGISPHAKRTDTIQDDRKPKGSFHFPLWLAGAICLVLVGGSYGSMAILNASDVQKVISVLMSLVSR